MFSRPNLHVGRPSEDPRLAILQGPSAAFRSIISSSRSRTTLRADTSAASFCRPQWDRDTRLWVADVLAEDSRAFLKKYGKPEDFWQRVRPRPRAELLSTRPTKVRLPTSRPMPSR